MAQFVARKVEKFSQRPSPLRQSMWPATNHRSQPLSIAVDCDSCRDRKFLISLQKTNHPSQVAADSQCSVNQPWIGIVLQYWSLLVTDLNDWMNEQTNDERTNTKSSSKVEWTGALNFCLYASSIYVIQGWLELCHTRLTGFHPSMSSGSSKQAALCIHPRIRRACSFYLTIWLWNE